MSLCFCRSQIGETYSLLASLTSMFKREGFLLSMAVFCAVCALGQEIDRRMESAARRNEPVTAYTLEVRGKPMRSSAVAESTERGLEETVRSRQDLRCRKAHPNVRH